MLNTPEFLIVHHTGAPNSNPLLDTSNQTYEIVDNYHKSLGWEGFGYHYFIDKGGALKAGRAENYHGAHTLGYNQKSIGICLAGNFDATLPTKEQTNTLAVLLTELRKKYLIPRENVVPHRHFANKSCYGKNLPDTWAQGLTPLRFNKAPMRAHLKALLELVEELPDDYVAP